MSNGWDHRSNISLQIKVRYLTIVADRNPDLGDNPLDFSTIDSFAHHQASGPRHHTEVTHTGGELRT